MKVKILIDMNLSPRWVDWFSTLDVEAVHWSSVGMAYDADALIFEYAYQNDYTIFTHDLDFGAILAASNTSKPSVIQLRDEDILPNENSIKLIVNILQQFENELIKGALITINKQRTKIRILPIA
jgi:predicted nuclease of predicted toxin-antitoxin system